MPVIKPETLVDFVGRIFQAAGTGAEAAHLVAQSLVTSDMAGHESHGVVRVSQYLNSINTGEMDARAAPVIVRESAVVTMVDARRSFGQVAAHFAMTRTVEKARAQGLAATGLFNCGHVGRLGEWVQMAADQGLIGLAFCNGGRGGGIVAPHGGAARRLGTNPIAAAIPVDGQPPVVLDFATSAVAEGKVRVARNRGRSIPEGWILDSQGRPTTDPTDLYAGGMLLPAAGHKGYGLSLLVEFLGGILTGGGCPAMPGFVLGNGVLFLALAVDAFRPMQDFLADAGEFADRVKAVPPAPGFDEVLLPGEPEQRTMQARTDGVPVDDATWSQLTEAAVSLGVEVPG